MKKYIGLIAILFLIPSLGIAGDEIINGVLQEAGGSSEWTLSGTGITPTTATTVAVPSQLTATTTGVSLGTASATSLAVPSQLTATASGVSLGTATATSLAVPSGFTATTAGAQASEMTVTTLRATGNTYANTITMATGRLGIGTTAPAGPIDLSQSGGDTTTPVTIKPDVANKGILLYGGGAQKNKTLETYIESTAGYAVLKGSAGVQLMNGVTTLLLAVNGKVQIPTDVLLNLGTDNGWDIIHDSGTAQLRFSEANNENLYMAMKKGSTASAGIVAYTPLTVTSLAGLSDVGADANGRLQAASDARMKNLEPSVACPDCGPISATLDDIAKLQAYKYQWKKDSGVNVGIEDKIADIGFTAQDVDAVFPGVVPKKRNVIKTRIIGVDSKGADIFETYTELEDVPHLNYSNRALVAYLVEALKDANNRIKALEASNADILNRLEALEAK